MENSKLPDPQPLLGFYMQREEKKEEFFSELQARCHSAEPWLIAVLAKDMVLVADLIRLDSDLLDGSLWMDTALMMGAYDILEAVAQIRALCQEDLQESMRKDPELLLDLIHRAGPFLTQQALQAYQHTMESPLAQAYLQDKTGKLFQTTIQKILSLGCGISHQLYMGTLFTIQRMQDGSQRLADFPRFFELYRMYRKDELDKNRNFVGA